MAGSFWDRQDSPLPIDMSSEGVVKQHPSSSAITEFWQSLPGATFGNVDQIDFLKLPETVYWMGQPSLGNHLLLRQGRQDMLKQAKDAFNNKMHIYVISGTEGTGKSAHLGLFMHEARRLNKNVILHKSISKQEEIYQLFQSTGEVFELGSSWTLRNLSSAEAASTLYLVDAVQPNTEVSCQTVVAVSPKETIISAVEKMSGSFVSYNEPWTLKELNALRSLDYSHIPVDKLRWLFHIWGGSVRWCLGKGSQSESFHLSRIETALTNLKHSVVLSYMKEAVGHPAASKKKGDTAHIPSALFHWYPQIKAEGASLDDRVVAQYRLASEHVIEQFLGVALEGDVKQQMRNVREIVALVRHRKAFRSCYGVFYEHLFHLYMVQQRGGPLTLEGRKLTERSGGALSRFPFRADAVQTFKRVKGKDIHPVDAQYSVPESSTFESIDSFLPPGDLFQVTVADKHEVKAKGLLDMMSTLERESLRLFFVVPSDSGLRKEQKIEGSDAEKQKCSKIEQFILYFDPDQGEAEDGQLLKRLRSS